MLTKSLLESEDEHPHVTMQVFQKEESILGGIDEAIAVLKTSAGHQTAASGCRAGIASRSTR